MPCCQDADRESQYCQFHFFHLLPPSVGVFQPNSYSIPATISPGYYWHPLNKKAPVFVGAEDGRAK
jgi:hypothetical protein